MRVAGRILPWLLAATFLNMPAHAEEGEADAVTLEAAYTADVWYNNGGVSDDWRYLDNLDLTAEVDLEQAIGWHGAKAFGYVLYNNGKSLSELTGDAFVVSNIETGTRALRLYEAWLEAPIGKSTSLKVGLYDLNSEFDALDSSALFIGSAHGIGVDLSQTGDNGPSIFPVTSLSARLQVDLSEKLTLRAAVLDGVPGDPASPKATKIKLGNGDGALLFGELAYGNDDGRLLAGAWSYTSDFDRNDGMGRSRSQGVYLRGEAKLADLGEGRLYGFARLGIASGETNQFDRFASAGLKYGLANENSFGLAIAHASTSDSWRAATAGRSGETAIEATYSHTVTDWLELQPNIQYVINPSSNPAVNDAIAFGLRVAIAP